MIKNVLNRGGVFILLPFWAIFLIFTPSMALAEVVTLPSDQEITVEEYGSASATSSILWLHSERGITAELQKTLLAISNKEDVRILLPDWLDSYFISPTRTSLEKVPQQDYEDLIAHYAKAVDKLFIVSNSRSASLVLNATHHLQTQGIKNFAGIILIGPYLQTGTPKPGKSLSYQEIATHSNLPLYVMQSERSPRYLPTKELVKTLQKGGSPVFTHIHKGVVGGFHMRDKDSLNEIDLAAKNKFPKDIANALFLLDQSQAAPLKEIATYQKNIRKKSALRLHTVDYKTPALALNDTKGKTHDIADYKGKVVLVSFWASWCRPCIEEMPSLVKLQQKYHDKLQILAVNVREDKSTIERFTSAMNINFPLLLDSNSKMTEDWKVYVYPSNYIVDTKGKLRYAATGAMDWQDKKLEGLLEELF